MSENPSRFEVIAMFDKIVEVILQYDLILKISDRRSFLTQPEEAYLC